MNNFAVIKTGGKQYRVVEDDVVRIEKIDAEEGDKVSFDEVLMVSKDDEVSIGEPYLENSSVEAEVVEQGRGDKKIVFKYKPKKRHRKKAGHRQPYTAIKITAIK